MRIEIIGFKELDEALEKLPASLRREVVLKALKKAAEPMLREARARARRQPNPRRRGGAPAAELKSLADSITVSAVKENSGFPNEVAVKLGPDADHFYGLFVEKGTRARGRAYRDNRGKFRRNVRRHAATRASAAWSASMRPRIAERTFSRSSCVPMPAIMTVPPGVVNR